MVSQAETVYDDGFAQVERNPADKHIRVRTTDSVAVLIYNRQTDNVILVSQERFPMEREDNPSGRVEELVAGRFDREVGLVDLIIAEVQEEIGVEISAEQVKILNHGVALAESPGIMTERIYLGFAVVDIDETEGFGKEYGVDGERINRVSVPVSILEDMVFDDLKTFAVVQWFLNFLKNLGYGDLKLGLHFINREIH